MKIYVNCSLPRSGSTLLQNILNQNPRIYGSHTSGLLDTLFNIRNTWHKQIEHKAHPNDSALRRVLQASFNAYYADIEKPIVVDKSRGWLAYLELLEEITQEKAKVLVCIRPIPDILASLEVLYRETAKIRQPPGEVDNYFQFQTIRGRCNYWMHSDQVLGLALARLRDAMGRGHGDRLLFIDFNNLTSSPQKVFKEIYNFLEEDFFDHDFENIEQVTQEDDEIYGFVNLHKIRSKVSPVKSRALKILGQDVINSLPKN